MVLDWNAPSIRFYQKLGAKLRRQWILTRLTGAALTRLARSAHHRGRCTAGSLTPRATRRAVTTAAR